MICPRPQGGTVGNNLAHPVQATDRCNCRMCGLGAGHVDDHGVAAQLALQLLGGSLRYYPPAIDDGEPVSQLICLVQIMRRQQHCDAIL